MKTIMFVLIVLLILSFAVVVYEYEVETISLTPEQWERKFGSYPGKAAETAWVERTGGSEALIELLHLNKNLVTNNK